MIVRVHISTLGYQDRHDVHKALTCSHGKRRWSLETYIRHLQPACLRAPLEDAQDTAIQCDAYFEAQCINAVACSKHAGCHTVFELSTHVSVHLGPMGQQQVHKVHEAS